MIVNNPGLPEADRPWMWQTSQREASEGHPHPGDPPMLEQPGDEPPIAVVSPPLIARVFPGL